MAITEPSLKLHNRAGVKARLNLSKISANKPNKAGHTLNTKQPTLNCLNISLSETYSSNYCCSSPSLATELKIKLFADPLKARIETQAGDLLRLENKGTQAHDSPLN